MFVTVLYGSDDDDDDDDDVINIDGAVSVAKALCGQDSQQTDERLVVCLDAPLSVVVVAIMTTGRSI